MLNSTNKIFSKNENNSDYTMMVVHDLKSPTQSQINALELLCKGQFGALSSTQLSVIENILDSCYHMEELISNLLFDNQFDEKNLNYDYFLFSEMAKSCALELSYYAHKKIQQIKVIVDIDEEELIFADKMMLKRAIYNLLTNAVNYSYENTEIIMNINQSPLETSCCIKSYGKLMSEELIKKIFCYGIKGQKSLGNGFGLNIVKKIIDCHKGLVEARVEGQDCNIFEFIIPNNT